MYSNTSQHSLTDLQKNAKRARYEREKDFTETLRAVGCTIREYVDDGRGEADATAPLTAEDNPVDADPVVEHQCAEEDDDSGDDKCE